MGKIKSAIFIAFYSLLIAVLGFVCFVSFPYGEDNVYKYNSILSITQKDANLGGVYGTDNYLGGGYSVVYYPEGVISAQEYTNNLGAYEEGSKEYTDYRDEYAPYGQNLYLNKETVCGGGESPSEEFIASFEKAKETIGARYANLKVEGARVDVQDDYTLRIYLPQKMENELTAFTYLSYMGNLTVKYGTSESDAVTIMPARTTNVITDYIKNVTVSNRNGGYQVHVKFTKAGKTLLSEQTAGVEDSDSTNYIYFVVGEDTVINLSVSDVIDSDLYISSTSYTLEIATTVATVLDSALGGTEDDITFTLGSAYKLGANYGDNALLFTYIAIAVCIVAMLVFFFVRYHLLGFVHLYTFLAFTIATVLCVWSIGFIAMSVEVLAAYLLMSVVLSVSNLTTFEYARKCKINEGKTMEMSIKMGYKKSMWHLFDLHIALALVGFVGFGIAIGALRYFLFTIGLLSVFSGICSLAINRFTWATLMALHGNTEQKREGFCNFKPKGGKAAPIAVVESAQEEETNE